MGIIVAGKNLSRCNIAVQRIRSLRSYCQKIHTLLHCAAPQCYTAMRDAVLHRTEARLYCAVILHRDPPPGWFVGMHRRAALWWTEHPGVPWCNEIIWNIILYSCTTVRHGSALHGATRPCSNTVQHCAVFNTWMYYGLTGSLSSMIWVSVLRCSMVHPAASRLHHAGVCQRR